jgi:hypothetical protein
VQGKTPLVLGLWGLRLLQELKGIWATNTNINQRRDMLFTIAVILFILWLLGLITSYTLGGFIHILLVLAIIAIVVQLISGRSGPPPPAV